MSKVTCRCGAFAHKVINGRPYCLKCAPRQPKKIEPSNPKIPKVQPKPPSNKVKKYEQSIELCMNKIGPKIKPTPLINKPIDKPIEIVKKKSWWKKLLEYFSNPFDI